MWVIVQHINCASFSSLNSCSVLKVCKCWGWERKKVLTETVQTYIAYASICFSYFLDSVDYCYLGTFLFTIVLCECETWSLSLSSWGNNVDCIWQRLWGGRYVDVTHWKWVTGGWKNCTLRCFIICTLYQILLQWTNQRFMRFARHAVVIGQIAYRTCQKTKREKTT
jgi:hypothetical protein